MTAASFNDADTPTEVPLKRRLKRAERGLQFKALALVLPLLLFLLFTFVVAGLFLPLSIETGAFVHVPGDVLGLMGISSGTFVVSKAVSNQANKVDQANEPDQRKRT